MDLILVRHGETDWNKEKRVQGWDSDIALNQTGVEQAGRLATFLRDRQIVAVLASPMRRARATAEPIARYHGLQVEVDEDLKEIRVGELEGMSLAGLGTTFSRFLMQRWQAGGKGDGETLLELQERAWAVVEGVLGRHRADPRRDDRSAVVIVSHCFVTLAIILRALDLPPDWFTRFRVDLGGVSVLEFTDHGTRLLTFNTTSY